MRKSKRIEVRIFEYELNALKRLCQETTFNDEQKEKLIRSTVEGLSSRLKREYDEKAPTNRQLTTKFIKFLLLYLTALSVIGTVVLIYSIFK